jgi:hypothetical protein
MSVASEPVQKVAAEWKKAWPEALNAWSKFTRLRSPLLCETVQASRSEGLKDSFAMIRLVDQAIVIDLTEIIEMKLTGYGVEILAHEIGHHILAPANLTDHARLIARTRYGLPTYERYAPFVANLYTDALINDRLQRSVRLKLAGVYIRLRQDQPVGQVWNLYMRMYEILWSLKTQTLISSPLKDEMEGDAQLGARVIRSFGSEWLRGAGRFASLLLPYLIEDDKEQKKLLPLRDWADTKDASAGGDPAGITDCEPDEKKDAVHPSGDPAESGTLPPAETKASPGGRQGQRREPFEYGELLRAAGIDIDDHTAAIRYYREQARKYVLPFPRRKAPDSKDPLPEGLEPWEIGEPFDAIDWQQTVFISPRVIPGLTTVRRVWGFAEGTLPAFTPFDLDLYVDSSGSMANPQRTVSYPALAGAILCLSALRAGARVQVTLWSGTSQYMTTKGFIRDEEAALKILTGYFGGSTAFPIHMLRKTYCEHTIERPVHLMVVSDDGVTTMFDSDEQGNSGWRIVQEALTKAGGGGTLVLNIRRDWDHHAQGDYAKILRARDALGWDVYPIVRWEDLTAFARTFAKRHYQPETLSEHEMISGHGKTTIDKKAAV